MSAYDTNVAIFVTTDFIQFHRWEDASQHFPDRAYLENLHRHKFHVRLEISVLHNDRELEYHEVLDQLNSMISERTRHDWNVAESCEMMAQWIVTWARDRWPDRPSYSATVSEDGENGSTVTSWSTKACRP